MSIEQNKALVRRYFEEAPANPQVYDEIFASSFRFHTLQNANLTPQVVESTPEAERAAYQSLRSVWGDWHMTIEDVVAEGEQVVVRWTFCGTHQGDFHGLPPTGRRVTHAGINVFRIHAGKIAEIWDLFDRLWLWQQLGVLPELNDAIAARRRALSERE